MTPNVFVRGSSITFRANCKDESGAAFTPTKATLTLSFATSAGRITTSLDMPGGVTTWDSSAASDSMPVHWHIRASGGGEQVAQDGSFPLVAAEANPAT